MAGPGLFKRDDALTALTEAEGSLLTGRVDANGAIWVNAGGGSGTDIGDVDVLSVIPGTNATNLGKAVDSAAGATDTGVAIVAVRDDVLSALSPAQGDYTYLRTDSTGALWVNAGSGGSSEYAEDSAHVSGDYGVFLMGVRNDALAALSDTDGDYTPLSVDSRGRYNTLTGLATVVSSVTPTIEAALYATGDSMHTADMTFTGCARHNGGSGTITKLVVRDTGLQSAPGELWLFNDTLSGTTHTINTAWNLADADLSKCVGVIPLGPYYASTLNSVSVNAAIRLPFVCGGSTTSLYGVLVTRGAPTPVSTSDLTVVLTIARD